MTRIPSSRLLRLSGWAFVVITTVIIACLASIALLPATGSAAKVKCGSELSPASLPTAHAHKKAAIACLQKLDARSKVVAKKDGLLEVNDEINISPYKLNTMPPADLRKMLTVTKALRSVHEDTRRLSPTLFKQYKELTRNRLRTKAHHRYGERFLRQLHLSTHPLFKTMTEWERTRLFDIAREPVNVHGKKTPSAMALKKRFAAYAMSCNPKTVTEFVAHFQFARSEFVRHGEATGNFTKARAEAHSPQFFTTVRSVFNAIRAKIKPASKTKVKLSKRGLIQTSDKTISQQLRSMKLSFSDQHTLIYHVHKHHGEMPPNQRAKAGQSEVDAYLKSAFAVLKDKASKWSSTVSQDGRSKVLTFTNRTRVGSKTYHPAVIVGVDSSGGATIRSYIPDLS